MPKLLPAVVMGLVLAASHGALGEDKVPCTSNAMIVFDASGSMSASDFPSGESNRIDRVRQAFKKVLPRVASARDLGLVVYGPGSHRDDCENVDLRFRPMPNAATKIQTAIDRLTPDGRTPLTKSVALAADALGASDKAATIVLLTDGEETCGGDPCQLASQLRATRPNTVVHVIGYKLQSLDSRPPVSGAKCLDDATGGHNLTAETVEDLVRALEKTLGCDVLSLDGSHINR